MAPQEMNQVTNNSGELSQKRILVGCISLVCIATGLALYFYPGYDGLQGALLRVGMLLGAFWLAMPTKKRPAAWKVLQSNWALPGAIVAAILMPRFKAMFPVFAVLAGIAYFARPKSARK